MKRLIIPIVMVAVLLPLLYHATLFVAVANWGFPTVEGYQNYRHRDGQIRIELPAGYSISNLHFEGADQFSVSIEDHVATIRVGYTFAEISFDFANLERRGSVHFETVPKRNYWNRVVFRAESNPEGHLVFKIEENGVSRDPDIYGIFQTTEPQR